jgi:hypothetical protein
VVNPGGVNWFRTQAGGVLADKYFDHYKIGKGGKYYTLMGRDASPNGGVTSVFCIGYMEFNVL